MEHKFTLKLLTILGIFPILLSGCSNGKLTSAAMRSMQQGDKALSAGREVEASRYFDRAIAASGSSAESYEMAAAVCTAETQWDMALKYTDGAIKAREQLSDGSGVDRMHISELYRSRGFADWRLGRIEEAASSYKEAVDVYPQNAVALNDWGYMYADLGIKKDDAVRLTKRAVAMHPNDGSIIDSLGWAYFQKGEYKEAEKQLLSAAKLQPSEPDIRYHLARVFEERGDYSRAYVEYRKTLILSPSHDEAKRHLALMRKD